MTGTDVASSFVVPAEAVVSSLKHCRSGSSAPVFVAIDTRSAVAFGRSRLPTALHVPVLAEDAVKLPLVPCCFFPTRFFLHESGAHSSPACESHHGHAASHRKAYASQWQAASVPHHDIIL
jgi:hypothetical protein